jgi:microcystin-dependent protein
VSTFSGKTLPYGYVIADGAQYTQAAYPQGYAFAVTEVTAGNTLWTVDTTAKTFKVPDLRDRFLMSSASAAWATKAGEASHLLAVGEMPSHNHNGATGGGTTSGVSANHTHASAGGGYTFITNNPASGWSYGSVYIGGQSNQALWNYSGATDYISSDHSHSVPALSIPAQGGGAVHNNMPPYCVIALIVKIAGITVDPTSGIIQGPPGVAGPSGPPGAASTVPGPPGTRGSQWFTYVGTGTPPAGTFTGEADGDMCVRSSDSEVFKRVSGAWVDQNYAMGYAMQTAARMYRNAALTTVAGENVMPFDTKSYDPGNNLTLGASAKYTCPVAGFYNVHSEVSYTISPGYFYITQIYKNGVEVARGQYMTERSATSGDNLILLAGDVIQCNVGDTLQTYAYTQTPSALSVGSTIANYMSVVKVDVGGRPGPQGPAGPGGAAYSVQVINGATASYVGVPSVSESILSNGVSPMQLSITPSVPVWWEVTGHIGVVVKVDAVYNYLYGYVKLSPADQNGIASARSLLTQHSQVDTYAFRGALTRIFKLAANTTYTASLCLGGGDAGTWQYYQGADQLWLNAKAWVQ